MFFIYLFIYLFFNTAIKYSIVIHVQILFEYMHWFFYQIEIETDHELIK